MRYVLETGQVHVEFWRGNLRKRDHLEDLDVDVWLILKWIVKELVGWHEPD
jgi:hypothetical protein